MSEEEKPQEEPEVKVRLFTPGENKEKQIRDYWKQYTEGGGF